MKGNKKQTTYYTVWCGRKTGVFDNWPETQAQVRRYPGAQYAKFGSRYDAEKAYAIGYEKYISEVKVKSKGGRPLFLAEYRRIEQ